MCVCVCACTNYTFSLRAFISALSCDLSSSYFSSSALCAYTCICSNKHVSMRLYCYYTSSVAISSHVCSFSCSYYIKSLKASFIVDDCYILTLNCFSSGMTVNIAFCFSIMSLNCWSFPSAYCIASFSLALLCWVTLEKKIRLTTNRSLAYSPHCQHVSAALSPTVKRY